MDLSKTIFLMTIIATVIAATASVPSTRDIHIVSRDMTSDINQFCQKTTNPTLCLNTIKPHFATSSVDPLKALKVEVEATQAKAKQTIDDIQSLLVKPGTNKATKESLDICKKQYKDMLDAIVQTKASLTKNDVVNAKFQFSAVISYQTACTDSFEGGKIPFPEDSDEVFNLGGNCLDIIADMEKSTPATIPPPVQQVPSAYSNVVGTVS